MHRDSGPGSHPTRAGPRPARALCHAGSGQERGGTLQRFDIIVAADMTQAGDLGLRILRECEVQAGIGLATGLLNLPARPTGARVSADIHKALRQGFATIVDLVDRAEARLVVVHAPNALHDFSPSLSKLVADRVVLVHDGAPDPIAMTRWYALLFGRMSWAPTNRWVRAAIEGLRLPVQIEVADWRPVALPADARRNSGFKRTRLGVGYISAATADHWPASSDELDAMLPADGTVDVHCLGRPPTPLYRNETMPASWHAHASGDISVERLVSEVDALVYFPSADSPVLPDAAIGTALASGRLVALPRRFRPHFGTAPLYCEPADALRSLTAAWRDPAERGRLVEAGAAQAIYQFPAAAHVERIERLAGLSLGEVRSAAPVARRRRPRALFVPSNGVGLGHVTRLLAVANRLSGRMEPVFATLAQSAGAIEAFGYRTEYIVSYSDSHAPLADWDAWFRVELERLIRLHDIDLVVFDGNNATPGLIHAALSRPPCRLAWVRRGMQKTATSPYLDNARYFDLIIEPGELAAERDSGATAQRRHEAQPVDPIRLLDETQLLDRAEAAAALGIDPAQPSVLVQLGSGSHRDVVAMVDAVVRALRRFAGLQIVIAEWENGAVPLSLWPGTRVVRGFPLSQYFNAFDFSVSAAGYNTFHEVMAFALPTVFIGNAHAAIDDQVARARFAQDAGAALELGEDELFQLGSVAEVLLDPRARDVLRANCRALARPNGAQAAADALVRLVGAGR